MLAQSAYDVGEALARVGTSKAVEALKEAAATGDRTLKKLAAARVKG